MVRDGVGILNGKRGLVFGAMDESSIGWQIAEAAYAQGAEIVLSNVPVALRLGEIQKLAEKCGGANLIPCDATDLEDLKKLFAECGSLDFIVHSIGMSPNIRKGREYTDLNYDWYFKTLDISAISLHKIISTALKADAIRDGASIVAMSYIAAHRNYSTYSDMGDAKALLESIVRSYGPRLAPRNIRINSVSQSPTETRAGSGIENFEKMFAFAEKNSPLGNATAAECADYVVMLLSDFTRKVTMQNLFHDGGYSAMGITLPMLRLMYDALQDPEKVREAEEGELS